MRFGAIAAHVTAPSSPSGLAWARFAGVDVVLGAARMKRHPLRLVPLWAGRGARL